jgi:hypothetical protein
MLDERFAALANDYLAAPGLPDRRVGLSQPMSAVSTTSPPTHRDSTEHHGRAQGRLRLGTPPILVPIERPPPVVGMRRGGVMGWFIVLAQLGRDRALLDIVDEALVSDGLLESLLRGQLEVVQDHRNVEAELDRRVPLGPVRGERAAA